VLIKLQDEKELEQAPYWAELIALSVPRGKEGDFTRTHSWSGRIRDCRVLEVDVPIRLRLPHPGGIFATSKYLPGDAIVRRGRPANKAEVAMAFALTGREIDRIEIGVRFADPRALFTALRAYGRNIEENILGVKETILGEDVELPGQIHQLLDRASQLEALDKATGILETASEILRITNKIQRGFRSAYLSLGTTFRLYKNGKIRPRTAASRVANARLNLDEVVARFNPFTGYVRNQIVDGLSDIIEVSPDDPGKVILRAMAVIKKGWQGEIVDSDELDRVRKRIARAREKKRKS